MSEKEENKANKYYQNDIKSWTMFLYGAQASRRSSLVGANNKWLIAWYELVILIRIVVAVFLVKMVLNKLIQSLESSMHWWVFESFKIFICCSIEVIEKELILVFRWNSTKIRVKLEMNTIIIVTIPLRILICAYIHLSRYLGANTVYEKNLLGSFLLFLV